MTVFRTPPAVRFPHIPSSWKPIVDDIDSRYDSYLEQERRVNRQKIVDNRVHCCLYFISPTGHNLRAIDVIVLKKLSEVVNVVPVIAKSDSLTLPEREAFKQKVYCLHCGNF